MNESVNNRFEDFFANEKYIALKNSLYNYLLRKSAVEKAIGEDNKGVILEVGSGLSPVVTSWDQIVYTDISYSALKTLKKTHGRGFYVVADSTNLPFKEGSFSHVISSEVIEHIQDDRKAVREIAKVTKPNGVLLLTFPHRRFYFASDDRFVNHYRRYELSDIFSLLNQAGFSPVIVRKILGPLEKITMITVTGCISILQKPKGKPRITGKKSEPGSAFIRFFRLANRLYAALARFDAFIMPRPLSAVLLVKAVKNR